MSTITRSFGISPGVPWGGPLPGGGYEGKTRRLDLAVQRCAKWLGEHFACPVEIRFNSDRQSGGAFIYQTAPNKMPMLDAPEIGLGARLTLPPDLKRKSKRLRERGAWAEDDRLWQEWRDEISETTPVEFNVLVYPIFLRDPADLGEYTGHRNPTFGYWTVNTAQEAYRLVRRLVKEELT